LHQPENIKTADMAVFLVNKINEKLQEKGYKNLEKPKPIQQETKKKEKDLPSLF